ncbi:MAG: type 1 glutamine amidotransferase, partial [Pseudomonadota bacterium]|nr:type 1 glutamine amidotransferase [Pseudomonadota bacterium]
PGPFDVLPRGRGATTMSGRVVIFQHMDNDSPGRFGEFLAADGFLADTVMLHRGDPIPSLDRYDLMLVLGGPMDVWEEDRYPWLAQEKKAIAGWVAAGDKPYLGICLGHQLLASALGGEVGLARTKEVGVFDIAFAPQAASHPLVAGLPQRMKVTQWHHSEVRRLPAEAVCLAASPATPVQVMAVGDVALGTQFHAEWTNDFIARWESFPSYMRALEAELGPGAYPRIRKETAAVMAECAAVGRTLYDNLMNRSGLKNAA